MPGWQMEIDQIRHIDELPINARRYVDRLSELIGIPVEIISVGPDREQTILAKDAG